MTSIDAFELRLLVRVVPGYASAWFSFQLLKLRTNLIGKMGKKSVAVLLPMFAFSHFVIEGLLLMGFELCSLSGPILPSHVPVSDRNDPTPLCREAVRGIYNGRKINTGFLRHHNFLSTEFASMQAAAAQ